MKSCSQSEVRNLWPFSLTVWSWRRNINASKLRQPFTQRQKTEELKIQQHYGETFKFLPVLHNFLFTCSTLSTKTTTLKINKLATVFNLASRSLVKFYRRFRETVHLHIQARRWKQQVSLSKGKGKGKAIPLQAWTGPENSRSLKLPDFKPIGIWRW
jgi:hypothetical protein